MQYSASQPTIKLALQGIKDTLALSIAALPWALLTGGLAIQAGFTPAQTMFMSVFVFAGAAQLSAITLTSAGAPMSAILSSTVVISARHLLYSVVFREHVITLPLRWRCAIAFVLTDEMFVLSQAHTQKTGQFSAIYALCSGFTFHLAWSVGTLVGIVGIDYLGDLEVYGLDFAIAAIFIAMTCDQIRSIPIMVAIVVSAVVSVIAQAIAPDSYILIAGAAGMCAAYMVDNRKQQKLPPNAATIQKDALQHVKEHQSQESTQ